MIPFSPLKFSPKPCCCGLPGPTSCHSAPRSSCQRWVTPELNDTVHFASDPQHLDRRVDHPGEAFASEVVNDRQYSNPPPAVQRVRHDVEPPALVRSPRQDHRRSRASACFRAPLADPKLFLAVEPKQPLVVQPGAFPRSQSRRRSGLTGCR